MLTFEARIAIGLIDILEQVHKFGIVHRDLSPSNVYILEDVRYALGRFFFPYMHINPQTQHVMLNDFGFAARYPADIAAGTIRYAATEVLRAKVARTPISYLPKHDLASVVKLVWTLAGI